MHIPISYNMKQCILLVYYDIVLLTLIQRSSSELKGCTDGVHALFGTLL